MTTLKERIANLKEGLKESPLDDAWEGGYETCREEALSIITQQQEAIQIMKEALDEVYNNTKCAKYNSLDDLIKEADYLTRENLLEIYQDCCFAAREALEKTDKILEE